MVGPFKSLMVAGKKLFLSWMVHDLRLLYLFPDWRRWPWFGDVGVGLGKHSKKSHNTRLKSNRFIWQHKLSESQAPSSGSEELCSQTGHVQTQTQFTK